jgi:pilus assembly protein CpaC
MPLMQDLTLRGLPLLLCGLVLGAPLRAFAVAPAPVGAVAPAVAQARRPPPIKPTEPTEAEHAEVEAATDVRLSSGKSVLIRLNDSAARLAVGNPEVADVMLINPREVYLLGKKSGATNLFIWSKSGKVSRREVAVGVDI